MFASFGNDPDSSGQLICQCVRNTPQMLEHPFTLAALQQQGPPHAKSLLTAGTSCRSSTKAPTKRHIFSNTHFALTALRPGSSKEPTQSFPPPNKEKTTEFNLQYSLE